jgi:hypothetical protein
MPDELVDLEFCIFELQSSTEQNSSGAIRNPQSAAFACAIQACVWVG